MNKFEMALSVPQEMLRVPSTMINAVGAYVVQVAEFVVEATGDQKAFAKELEKTQPINDAEVAINTLSSSKKALDEAILWKSVSSLLRHTATPNVAAEAKSFNKVEDARVLRNTGYGALKLAALKAARKDAVPAVVTQSVVYTALDHGADASLQGFVPDSKMEPVADLFDAFNNVRLLHRA